MIHFSRQDATESLSFVGEDLEVFESSLQRDILPIDPVDTLTVALHPARDIDYCDHHDTTARLEPCRIMLQAKSDIDRKRRKTIPVA